MKRIQACLPRIAMVVLLVAPLPAAAAESDTDGKTVFTKNKCNMCHSVASAGIEARVKAASMKGPDLGGTTVESEGLIEFMRKKAERNGKLHKNAYKGTDDEFRILLEWLREQAAPPSN